MTDDNTIRVRFRRWWETCAVIKGRDAQLIEEPKLNPTQRQIDDAIEWCEIEGVPCWLIILKPRKDGATTILVGKSYHLLRQRKAHLLQVGDQLTTSKIMWAMLKLYAGRDKFKNWLHGLKKMTEQTAEWLNGSTASMETAGDKRAGQGDTPTVIHAEEVAHWGKDGGAASAADSMLALLNAIADTPGTYVFVSSTPNGIGNWYHRTTMGAVTLAERKTGQKGNGWILIFARWFDNPLNRKQISPEEAHRILNSPPEPGEGSLEREESGRTLYGWTTDQLAWRRETISKRCDGKEHSFDQEYPESLSRCFLAGGNPRFDVTGVTVQQSIAAKAAKSKAPPKYGTLEKNEQRLTWLEQPEGWIWMAEPPMLGLKYVAFADPMTGEQSAGSANRDAHACGIIRAGYMAQDGWRHPRIAAVIHVPKGCRWDMDILVDRHYRLIRHYGRCVVIPEANNAGVEYIRLMRQLGANIWKREKTNAVHPGKKLEVYGFMTSTSTRHNWVGAVAEVIREQEFVCEYGPACEEFATFVTDETGKDVALDGCHDDWVTGIGLGLLLVKAGNATIYSPPNPVITDPAYAGHRLVSTTAQTERHGACS